MLKIAAIGDVHDQWHEADNQALEALEIDLALFVGDFGNESLEVVQKIANLPLPKAVILGNHDAWYTATPWGRKKCPYDRNKEDRLQAQLDLLQETHVGYNKLDFSFFNLSVVGSRPFSWGGEKLKYNDLLKEKYNISDLVQSRAKIAQVAQETAYSNLIFLGHNGPSGLGEQPEDICGRDWKPMGGDHGDPDLAGAIADAKALNKQVSLVVFGHMHHRLRHTKERLRTRVVKDDTGTVYLNAASVPRVIEKDGEKLRNFSIVTWDQGRVQDITLVWVNQAFQVVDEEILYMAVEERILV